jgi:hypothetical protein
VPDLRFLNFWAVFWLWWAPIIIDFCWSHRAFARSWRPRPSSRAWGTHTPHAHPQHTNTGLGRTGSSPPPDGRGRRGGRAACARERAQFPCDAAQPAGCLGYRDNILAPRERSRTKICTVGQNMRPPSPYTLAQGGNFSLRPFVSRKERGFLARFSSIWLFTAK